MKDADLFFTPTPEDTAEVESTAELLHDVNDMHLHLGEPDETFTAHPENKSWVKQFNYFTRWATVELCIQEKSDGTLEISYSGKLRHRRIRP
ncbi:MAG: hypothetical protein Aurels2KO_21510 [Aureliella sp.]